MTSAMTSSSDSHRVGAARRFYALLADKNIADWLNLWTDDAAIIVLYPPEGFDNRIDGREAIGAAFTGLFANFASFRSDISAVYAAPDSEAVIVEYSNRAVLANGAEYTNDNIAVFRFRGDKIFAYHDYFDPRRFDVVVRSLSA